MNSNESLISQFIFGSQHIFENELELSTFLDGADPKDRDSPLPRVHTRDAASPYVSVIEGIINDLWQLESHLFTEEEHDSIRAFSNLSYPSRYILVRLAFRKNGWHTRSSLQKYVSEVGEKGIDFARKELCLPIAEILQTNTETVKKEEEEEVELGSFQQPEVIDLTGDDSDDESSSSKPSRSHSPSSKATGNDDAMSFFCQNEGHMSLDEALDRLSVPQLKDLAKQLKAKPKLSTKEALISALKKNAQSQGNLLSMFTSGGSSNQETRLQKLAVKQLDSCLRVNSQFRLLLRRIHVIFYRSTSLPKNLFLDSLLNVFNKRAFPPYTYSRSLIWDTIDGLRGYEKALELQQLVETVLDDTTVIDQSKAALSVKVAGFQKIFSTPVITKKRPISSVQPVVKQEQQEMEIDTPEEAGGVEYQTVDLSFVFSEDFELLDDDEDDGKRKASPERLLAAARVVKIYELVIRPMWEWCVRVADGQSEKKDPCLERFDEGYILARLLGKAAEAYALLHRYPEELDVLQMLLDQKHWRRAKRGKWYERRALVKDTHLPRGLKSEAAENGWTKDYFLNKKKDLWENIRQDLYEALEDEDTHLVYRRSLVNRLTIMEKRLGIPFDVMHSYGEELQPANDVLVFGDRAEKAAKQNGGGLSRWKGKGKETGEGDIRRFFSGGLPIVNDDAAIIIPPPSYGKSMWKGDDGSCNVESYALQHYANELGYKGFHSETAIITTIFALLCWDIIFANVPGAFETKFQIAPLDLVEDSFYYAREEMIEQRLKELREGKALEILERHDRMYREKKACCVGVRWDVCGKEDLAQIVECMSGETLAILCKLLCQDYPARASGVPDLIVWNHEKLECRFVEVKGPGDRASENQKLWFDTLLGAGLEVDLCRVLEFNTANVNKEKEKKDKLRAKKEKQERARIKKEETEEKKRQTPARQNRKRKRVKEESDTEEDERMGESQGLDDDADYLGLSPENVGRKDGSVTDSRAKRHCTQDLDTEERGVLVGSQDKVDSSIT